MARARVPGIKVAEGLSTTHCSDMPNVLNGIAKTWLVCIRIGCFMINVRIACAKTILATLLHCVRIFDNYFYGILCGSNVGDTYRVIHKSRK